MNKRTARLACNIPLVKNHLVPLSFNDVDKDDYASAMIAIYEKNDVTAFAELYCYSYLRSCQLYNVTAESMGIDVLRVKYRQQRRNLIREIVQQNLHGNALEVFLAQEVQMIPLEHQEKYLSDARTDLRNIAPYTVVGMGISAEELSRWLSEEKG